MDKIITRRQVRTTYDESYKFDEIITCLIKHNFFTVRRKVQIQCAKMEISPGCVLDEFDHDPDPDLPRYIAARRAVSRVAKVNVIVRCCNVISNVLCVAGN